MEHVVPIEIIQRVFETAIITDPKHSSHLALVCKCVHEFLTPLLYRDVTILTGNALDKFAKSLTENPGLGELLKSLWLGPMARSSWEPGPILFAHVLDQCLVNILTRTPKLKRLALINLPPWSTAGWLRVESALPKGLERLATGPDHAVLTEATCYPALRWLCSIDTQLTQEEFGIIHDVPKLLDFHWCFISERIDLQSVRNLTGLLASRPWNSVCLYVVEADDVESPDFSEDLEMEMVTLYEDRRVKKYQLFHVEDWCSAFFRHWTVDWA